MPYTPPKNKGLGFSHPSDEGDEYQRRNHEAGRPSPADAERWEGRNARWKHQPTAGDYDEPYDMTTPQNRYKRRANYQRMAPDHPEWADADKQEGAVRFEEDFKRAMDDNPYIYENPSDYSPVNYDAWLPLRNRWLKRARDYGLTEEEADNIMSSFAFAED